MRRTLATPVMDDFAERTGVGSDRPPKRYLWTDAFAVCNWLGLYDDTAEERFLELARVLVDQVHRVLGRHRPDDEREGWISGLPEEEGRERPTAGGLRIGKPRPERGASERYDPRAEWDRDGQYYHYLTKWMHALNRMWRVTGEATYHRQSVDLARAAHHGFMIASAIGGRLCWKVSIDLSRPLVPSSGHHDPVDGLLATSAIAATRPSSKSPDPLSDEVEELTAQCEGRGWATEDPLGVGGLLVDTLRCAELAELDHTTGRTFLGGMLRDAHNSLERLSDLPFLRQPADTRLAFRELGLALGLLAVRRLEERGIPPGMTADGRLLHDLVGFGPVGPRIVDFWSREGSRRAATWVDHRDISEVMWATCLAPDGFLEL